MRANNTIAYFLPGNLGGFNGQFQVGFGENTGGVKTNNYVGFRVGYAAGSAVGALRLRQHKGCHQRR